MEPARSTPDVLYQEWVPAGLLVRATVTVLAVAVALAFVEVLLAAPLGNVPSLVVLAIVEVFLLALYLNYRGIRLEVTRECFEARYGLFNRTRISVDDLLECRPGVATFPRYWGIGVRFGTDGSVAYTTQFGPAARIERSGRRTFVTSTRHPPELCAALQEASRGRARRANG